MMGWMADLFGLSGIYKSSKDGGGVFQASASKAFVILIIAARYLRVTAKHINDKKEKTDASCTQRGKLVALGSTMARRRRRR